MFDRSEERYKKWNEILNISNICVEDVYFEPNYYFSEKYGETIYTANVKIITNNRKTIEEIKKMQIANPCEIKRWL